MRDVSQTRGAEIAGSGVPRARPIDVALPAKPTFEQVYDTCFEFVWRSARRLGVAEDALDDVVQEIFLVVLRRLADFEGRSSMRTWLFGITVGVVRNHRRSLQRKGLVGREGDPDALQASEEAQPDQSAANAEAVRVLYELLDTLDQRKREVFIVVELEELSLAEAASALDLNVNTVASRLRAARQEFDEALARRRKRERT